jgi:hypothetical protein
MTKKKNKLETAQEVPFGGIEVNSRKKRVEENARGFTAALVNGVPTPMRHEDMMLVTEAAINLAEIFVDAIDKRYDNQ